MTVAVSRWIVSDDGSAKREWKEIADAASRPAQGL